MSILLSTKKQDGLISLMGQESNESMLAFYGWWQFAVCLFAFLALMSIWHHLGRRRHDHGQVWLALSILCWSVSGLFELVHHYFPDAFALAVINIEGWRTILSLLNSLFILLALPWFRYLPIRFRPLIESTYWKYLIGVPFLFALLPTLSALFLQKTALALSELDVYYAIMTLVFLGYVLWESFSKRKLMGLAWLTACCILLTLVAQIFKLGESTGGLLILSAIFKTCLIMIFFALALSWIKEIAEDDVFASKDLRMDLRKTVLNGRTELSVKVSGVGNSAKSIRLSSAHYALLEKFIARRTNTEDGWLEIKPRRSIPGKVYDIHDYNEVKRLLQALLDGIYGKKEWSKEREESTWKEVLFELSPNRERKIRLRLFPNQVSLERS